MIPNEIYKKWNEFLDLKNKQDIINEINDAYNMGFGLGYEEGYEEASLMYEDEISLIKIDD